MDTIKLLLAFSPWIAFWVISGGHSMARLHIGIVVAAILVVVMGITRLHRGMILWAGVVFFAFAVVAVLFFHNMWVVRHLGVLASGTLFIATMISIVIGAPFTESYAREHVPRELWETSAFIRSGYTVTGAWAIIFLANALVNAIKPYHEDLGEWFFRGIEFAIIASGIVFTTQYARWAQRRREAGLD